jgi:hypothetical protein
MPSRPIYSTRFLAIALGEEDGAYVVPDGYVAVVRDIDCWSEGGAMINWRVSIDGDPAFAGGQFTIESLDQFQTWRGRVVVSAGENIQTSTDGPRGIVVGGYLLLNP